MRRSKPEVTAKSRRPPPSPSTSKLARTSAHRLAGASRDCGRAQTRLDVERREAARDAAVGEAGEGVDGVELVAAAGDERAAEGGVEEILLADGDGERLVGLRLKRARDLLLLVALAGRARRRRDAPRHGLGRAPLEEAVGDAELELVGVGDGVEVVEADDALEVADAGDFAVDEVRLDGVAEAEGSRRSGGSCAPARAGGGRTRTRRRRATGYAR